MTLLKHAGPLGMGAPAPLMMVTTSHEVKWDKRFVIIREVGGGFGNAQLHRSAQHDFMRKNMLELGRLTAIIRSFINLCSILRRNDQ